VEVMKQHIEDFIFSEFDFKKSIPHYLKDLIKTLLSLDMKRFASDYLNLNISFEVSDKLRGIEMKLTDISDKITSIV
jgi:hypothetical protein